METKVLAGSENDWRWPAPINPDKPQIIKPKPKKQSNALKKVRDENSALKIKLDDVTSRNTEIVTESRALENKCEKLEKDVKALKQQLSAAEKDNKALQNQLLDVKKEAKDVVKATTRKKVVKKTNRMSRKSTSKK